ncbi:MAG TPA: tRNA (adenosine(37)-N6)-threonylcarbamoyltransferase complex dimerization subunit type 1 TsaB [candidate division WOR-3 bacterium]|uniref:tRNA (Adenosine(37)-N6)-threonylcarbamoyltransferase complex dimerization subunit type 1 TsaB n=1 Tax=candidate division WOR-3 bacterium TaxID=2052148 RepID=A0A7V0XE61_UNCW3|nr:tRNA (adenosine(37)-N6)-threonylcarbamoyltransferase complex dimerization subunit type 1 TsaB [candidate division WOR-3 bacterium]
MTTLRGPVLGIESSGARSAVALARGEELIRESAREGTNHNEVLLELVDEVLAATGTGLDELAGIGVTVGPGMFTSLRVGIAIALGLALPRDIPLKAVGTLPALAETCRPTRRVLALLDARRGQVYCGLYDSGRALVEPCVIAPDRVGELLREAGGAGLPVAPAGSGVELCREALAGADAIDTGVRFPCAFAVAVLARAGIEREGADRPEDLYPRYLRRTDAEVNRERREDNA